jgi:hypothetical protein
MTVYFHNSGAASVSFSDESIDMFCGPSHTVGVPVTELVRNGYDFVDRQNMVFRTGPTATQKEGNCLFSISRE